MNKKSIIAILAMLGVAAAFYFILQNNKQKNQAELDIVAQTNNAVDVRTAIAQKDSVSGQFSVNGTFLPKTQAQISPEVGGQLISLLVQEGSVVKAGQVIARISGDAININLGNAKANLDNAKASLDRYEAAFTTGGVRSEERRVGKEWRARRWPHEEQRSRR